MEKTEHKKPKKRQAGRILKICLLLLFGMIFIAGAYIASGVLLEHKNAADAYGALRSGAYKSTDAAKDPTPEIAVRPKPETVTDPVAEAELDPAQGAVAGPAPKASHVSAEGPAAEAAPEHTPEASLKSDAGSVSGSKLESAQGSATGSVPQAASGVTPESAPGAAPETIAERTPKAVLALQSEAGRGEREQKAAAADPKGTDVEKQTHTAPVPRVSMDFSELREVCPDVRAWLFQEGTCIDYPVVQTDNNDYYLSHMYNGAKNSSGALFLDFRNTGLFTEQNSVIYGHRMKSGSMFGTLLSYKSQEYYEEHPTMLLYTPDGDYLIEFVCGTVEDGNHEFVRFEFENQEEFCSYIASQRSRSTFKSNVQVAPDDRIVSLCTCSYEQQNARYLLTGKLTPLMEDPAW